MREIKRDIVGMFILSADGKVLLGHNTKGGVYDDMWGVPGGGIESGENIRQAAIRETYEELQLDISKDTIDFFDSTFSAKAEKTLRENQERVIVDMTFFDTIVRLAHPAVDIQVKCEEYFAEARFFSKNELKLLKIAPPTLRRLRELELVDNVE